MVSVGVGAAADVGDQSAGALVAALAAAVDGANVLVAGIINSLNSLEEVFDGVPGAGLFVQVLQSAGSLEDIAVDGHAVGDHADGQLVQLAVGAGAGSNDGLIGAGGNDVLQVDQQALGAPVGDQTLGTFHDDVGSLVAFDGGVDLVVTVGVVQVLDLDSDVGVDSVEIGDQLSDGSLIDPLADGVGPQGDLHGSGAGGLGLHGILCHGGLGLGSLGLFGSLLDGAGSQGQNHDQSQQHCQNLLHNFILLICYFCTIPKSGLCFLSTIVQEEIVVVNQFLKIIFLVYRFTKSFSISHKKTFPDFVTLTKVFRFP